MKKIGRYISELLYWHDCVIVPGLGGLVANPVSAEVDEEKLMFMPPRKEIGFNRSLSHNDGLLINHVALQEGIDYSSAGTVVKQYVADILSAINSGASFQIDEVGTLKSDAIGNIIFQPDNSCGYLTDSFGFGTFHFEPIVVKEEEYTPKNSVRRVLRPISIRHIAASVAVMAGLFLFSPDANKQITGSTYNQAGYLDLFIPSTTETTVDNAVVVEEVLLEDLVKESVESKKESAVVLPKQYFIIAGSFPNDRLADQFVAQLDKKGYSETVKLYGNGKVRVAIEGFATKDEAVVRMKEYKMKQGFADVWVFADKK